MTKKESSQAFIPHESNFIANFVIFCFSDITPSCLKYVFRFLD